MRRSQLAADLADAIAEAEEMAAKAIWSELEPLIRTAWSRAVRPRTTALAASADDTALRHIAANWTPPPEVGRLITDLHREGALTALAGFEGSPLPDIFGPVYDQAAQNHLATAANRLQGIGDSAWSTARTQLTEFMGGPQTREDAKRALEETLRVSEFRADTIARTEMGGAANAGVQYSAETLAAVGFQVRKQWWSQHDGRTRPSHAKADGQEVPVDGHFTVGGYELARPGDPLGPAEEVINCRCTMLLVEPPGVAPERREPELSPWSSAPLTEDQYQEFRPRWDLRKRERVIKKLRETPAGKLLESTLSGFQSGGARGIPILKATIEKRLKGVALEPGAAARADNIIAAIRNSPIPPPATLYRGMKLPYAPDELIERWAKVDQFDLNLSSFTSSRKVASEYAFHGGAGRRATANKKRVTDIIFEVDTSHRTKALPIENLARNTMYAGEKEWLTGGRFAIDSITKAPDGRTVVFKLRQVAVLGD